MINLPKQHRLRGYDYSLPGFYFITICVHRDLMHQTPFPLGEIHAMEMVLSPAGQITQQVWNQLPDHFPNLVLDAFCIMPNHLHFILQLSVTPGDDVYALEPNPVLKIYPISQIIGALKSFSTREINRIHQTPGKIFWQKNYYDHVIRNEKSLDAIRQYINENPFHWNKDEYHYG